MDSQLIRQSARKLAKQLTPPVRFGTVPGGWEAMRHGRIFVSSSSDTLAERKRAFEIVHRLEDQLGISPPPEHENKSLLYAYETDNNIGANGVPLQEDVLRASDDSVELVVCIIGERVGLPLSRLQHFPPDVVEQVGRLAPEFCMPGSAASSDSTILTGTLFEIFDAMASLKPIVFFCKGEPDQIFNSAASDLAERRFGGGSYERAFQQRVQDTHKRGLTDAERGFLRAQLLGVKRLYDEVKNFQAICFGSPADFELKLERYLRGRFSQNRADEGAEEFRGLLSYSLADRDAFFGRDEEIDEVLRLVSQDFRKSLRSPILLLHGASGVGKSSFMNAGVGGRLVRDQNSGRGPPWSEPGQVWRPVALTPGLLRDVDTSTLSGEASKFGLVWRLCQLIENELGPAGVIQRLSVSLLQGPTREKVLAAITGAAEPGVTAQSSRNFPVLLFDQVEDLLSAPLSEEWREVFAVMGELCRQRLACAIFCVADTKAGQKASPGWLERWRSSELSSLLGQVSSYPLQHLSVDAIVEVMKRTFVRAGVEVPAETKSAFRRRLKQFESNTSTYGIAVHDALPIISVSLQLSERRRESRIHRERAAAIPREHVRDAQPGASQLAAIVESATPASAALKEEDLTPLEEAIERLAEDTFRAFVEEDLGVPWSDDAVIGQPDGHAEANQLLASLLSWLVTLDRPLMSAPGRRPEIDVSALAARSIEERYIGSRIGLDAAKLAQRLLGARLLKRELQTEVRLSHLALLSTWSRARSWLSNEYESLRAYQTLVSHRDNGGGQPSTEKLVSWKRLYSAWGEAGPWRPQTRGAGKEAGTDRAWLKRYLLRSFEVVRKPAAARDAFWVALLARDDEMATRLASHYAGDAKLRSALSLARLQSEDWRQTPPIMYAASHGLAQTFRCLLEGEVDPLAPDRLKQTLLHVLAERGDAIGLEQVRDLLRRRASNGKLHKRTRRTSLASANGWSPFHAAALGRSPEALGVLVEISELLEAPPPSRVDLSAPNFAGATALHVAVSQPDAVAASMVILLVAFQDQREVQDAAGALPLHLAVVADNFRTCGELLAPSRDQLKPLRSQMAVRMLPTPEAPSGHTPLSIAAHYNSPTAARALFDADVIKHAGWTVGREALRLAAASGAVEITAMLLERAGARTLGALIDDRDQAGRSTFHLAAKERRAGVLRTLLAHPDGSALVDRPDSKRQQTPLHWVVSSNDPGTTGITKDCIDALLDAGADASLKNDLGLTPFELALRMGMLAACQALRDRNAAHFAPSQIVSQCLSLGDKSFAHSVIEACSDADLSAPDERGRCLLHHAAYRGDRDIIQTLLNRRTNLVDACDRYRQRPLHSAALGNQGQAINALLAAGADIFAEQTNRRTALHLAVYDARHSAVTALLEGAGAGKSKLLEAEDKYGKTAILIASEAGDPYLVKVLLDQGADPTKRSTTGRRGVAHLAAHYGCLAVLETLLQLRPDVVVAQPIEGGGGLLHAAAAGGRTNVIDWLFQTDTETSQAALHTPNQLGWTPLGLAVARWSKEHNRRGQRRGLKPPTDLSDNASYEPLEFNDEGEEDASLELRAWRAVRALEDCLVEDGTNRRVRDSGILYAAVRSGEPQIVKRFIDRGHIEVVGQGGRPSAMHAAIELEQSDAFKMLLDVASSEDLIAADRFGRTPLHLACRLGRAELIPALVEKGARIDALDSFRATPADLALEHGHTEALATLERLAPSNVDPFGSRTHGHFVLQALETNDLPKLAAHLRSKDAGAYALKAAVSAAEKHNLPAIQLLRDSFNVDLTASDEEGVSPLLSGLRVGFDEILNEVSEDKLAAAARVAYPKGVTLLHAAAQSGSRRACEHLVEKANASNAARDHHERTPLHYAAARLREEAVDYLCLPTGNYQPASAHDEYGQTPLHMVGAWLSPRTRAGFFEASIKLLVAAGADLSAIDKRGQTPAELAESKGRKDVAKILRKLERVAQRPSEVSSLASRYGPAWLRRRRVGGAAQSSESGISRVLGAIALVALLAILALSAWLAR